MRLLLLGHCSGNTYSRLALSTNCDDEDDEGEKYISTWGGGGWQLNLVRGDKQIWSEGKHIFKQG